MDTDIEYRINRGERYTDSESGKQLKKHSGIVVNQKYSPNIQILSSPPEIGPEEFITFNSWLGQKPTGRRFYQTKDVTNRYGNGIKFELIL